MIKNYLLFIVCMACFVQAKSQSISPVETTEVCPDQEYTFTVTVPGTGPSVSPQSINIPPYLTQGAYNISTSSSGITTFNFKGRFADNNNKQTFRIQYTNSSGQLVDYDPGFKKIKSLLTASANSIIYPTPSSITSPRCQTTTHNISFNNIPYSNPMAAYKYGL